MKTPTPDEMRLAADWLEANDGLEGEAERCKTVAAWLNAQADAQEMRAQCRAAGVPVAKLRAKLRQTP